MSHFIAEMLCTLAINNRVFSSIQFKDAKKFYESKVQSGELTADLHQLKIIERLQNLQQSLQNYEPSTSKQSVFSKVIRNDI